MLNPYAKYIECINCGHDLTNINDLAFHTPDLVECDFCGQKYPGLSQKVKRTKLTLSLASIILAILLISYTWVQTHSIISGLFALMAFLVLYYYSLGVAIKKAIKF
jgi:hypothetical protein